MGLTMEKYLKIANSVKKQTPEEALADIEETILQGYENN